MQLQISRVFWLVDFVALICLIGLVRRERTATRWRHAALPWPLVRGVYVMTVEHPERALFAVHLPASTGRTR